MMKKIYITLFALLIAMVAMVYLYFSNLSSQYTTNDASLRAATNSSGLIFCMRNDQDIINILSGQDHFQRLIGEKKSRELNILRTQFLSKNAITTSLNGNAIFIGFLPGEKREYNYLITTQLGNKADKEILLGVLKENKIKTDTIGPLLKLTLNDSTAFFIGIKGKLLALSSTEKPVSAAIATPEQDQDDDFAAYIKSGDKFNKNSLANLYVDYNRFPELLKVISPNGPTGELSILDHQHSFAALSYNFSKERIFFNGSCKVNDSKNYFQLFTTLKPQKKIIDNILPENTANFSLFSIPEYASWKTSLDNWFVSNNKSETVKKTISSNNQKYHLNLDQVFPRYFKNQLITFQLSTAEKLGAIQLTNGDKLGQLLLDISTPYNEEINLLKEPDLLYCYFGEPFRKFRKPYYTIIDNYMVFANYPATLQVFLNHYRSNKLLINTPDYSNLYNQISDNSNITFYVHNRNSSNLILNTFYTNYFRYFTTKKGFGHFNAVVYQLSGDKGIFQSNLLINTIPDSTEDKNQDSLPAE